MRKANLIFALILCALLSAVGLAQGTADGHTPSGLAAGTATGSYALNDIESVNYYNGALSFHIPLLKIGGRGDASFVMTLPVSSQWTIQQTSEGIFPYYQNFYEKAWRIKSPTYGPGVILRRTGVQDGTSCDVSSLGSNGLTRLSWIDATGAEIELTDNQTNGAVISSSCLGQQNGANRGTVFTSRDGAGVTFISDQAIYDERVSITVADLFGWLIFRNGNRYRIENSLVKKIIDRNGNYIEFTYGWSQREQYSLVSVTDSLKRVINIAYDVNDGSYGVVDRITLKGAHGDDRVIRVAKSLLSTSLASGLTAPISWQAIFPGTSWAGGNFDGYVTTSVWLPDETRHYQFKYNRYGELARVTLPTGGAVEYDWEGGFQGGSESGRDNGTDVYRRIVQRRVYASGGTGSAYGFREEISKPEVFAPHSNTGYVDVKKWTSGNVLLARAKHYYHGSPFYSFTVPATSYNTWNDGREWRTEELADNNEPGAVVHRTENDWSPRNTVTPGGTPNEPRITETRTYLISTGQVSKQTFAYSNDPYNNVTDKREYDYGSGVPGAMLRHTHIDYLSNNPNVMGNPNYQTDISIHIRDLPTSVVITGQYGDSVTTNYEYDVYSGANHDALKPRYGIAQLDAAYTTSRLTRGNVTAITRVGVPSITTYSYFDIAGNLVKRVDGKGKVTEFYFEDQFGIPDDGVVLSNMPPTEMGSQKAFAFTTSIKNALGHQSYSQYDYYTGKVVETQDANGVKSAVWYTDLLERPKILIVARGTSSEVRTVYTYDDGNRKITVESDQLALNDARMKSISKYDGFGRVWRTAKLEGESSWLVTDKEFDNLGREYRVSNAYRITDLSGDLNGAVNPSGVWTTTAYDQLSRVVSVTAPDASIVTTVYSGNTFTVEDQAQKKRLQKIDSLGRVTEVIEDPGTGSSFLNYSTTYSYNVFDKLVTVTQGSQHRFWLYDNLGRKIALRVPEQSAPHSITDNVTQNNNWSAKFTYDENDNLLTRTDARGWVSTLAYDDLNRPTGITYSNTSPAFPAVTYEYDSATTYGVGRLYAVQRNNRIGSANVYNKETINNYDPHGRATKKTVGFLNAGTWKDYVVEQAYNLAGQVTQVKYPSGRTVDYTHSRLGLTTQVTGNLGVGGSALTYASNITYNAKGQPIKEQWGTDTTLYLNRHYNNRHQLYDIRLGTSSTDEWTWNRGALRYYHASDYAWGDGGADNNGQLYRAEHFVPLNDGVTEWMMSTDYYSYDRINRLTRVTENADLYEGGNYNAWEAFKQSFQFDRWGNLTYDLANSYASPTRDLDVDTATNRVTPDAGLGATISYDNNGNIIYDDLTGYSGANRVFDPDNKLYTSTDSSVSEIRYDGAGNRARKKVGTDETWYVYGIGGELLAEYAANAATGSPNTEYGYKGGQLLIHATSGARYWLVPDKFGTPRMMVLKTGALADVGRHDFLPFGEEIDYAAGARSTTAGYFGPFGEGVNQQFTGKERDAETNLDYFGARYYASGLGRFVSVDPLDASGVIERPQTWNRFSYVANAPTMMIDPSGLREEPVDDEANKTKPVVVAIGGGVSQGGTNTIVNVPPNPNAAPLPDGSRDTGAVLGDLVNAVVNNWDVNVRAIAAEAVPNMAQQIIDAGATDVIIYGYSAGAIAAVDLTNRLTSAGVSVADLILVDPPSIMTYTITGKSQALGGRWIMEANAGEHLKLNNPGMVCQSVCWTGSTSVTGGGTVIGVVQNQNFNVGHMRMDDYTARPAYDRISSTLQSLGAARRVGN